MTRLAAIDPATAKGMAKELLDKIQKQLGMTPNMMRTMAQSPAVLGSYLGFNAALGRGALDAKLRERIAIVVAETNSCQYCLSAHTAIGKMVGLDEEELRCSQQSASSDPKTAAALKFAQTVAGRHGHVSDDDLHRVRQAGYTDTEIAEIIANVALNVFTNYFNLVAGTEVDFPKVEPSAKQPAELCC
ncbi:MAG: carboxymuconolactone decarboxylase family protein [Nitrospiraceae bacterium]